MILSKLNTQKYKYYTKNIDSMRSNKIFFIVLFIFTFIYISICPSIHELGDNKSNDVILKVRTRILWKNLKNVFSFTHSTLSNNSLTGKFDQFTIEQNFITFSLSNPTLNLSILSTIRLIL